MWPLSESPGAALFPWIKNSLKTGDPVILHTI
jgi:hypothetical protein